MPTPLIPPGRPSTKWTLFREGRRFPQFTQQGRSFFYVYIRKTAEYAAA